VSNRVLGLDPGLRTTGWGVIDAADNRLRWIADGVVRSDEDLTLAERLAQLFNGVTEVVRAHNPVAVAVEETFVNKNPASTLKLGQARGAVISAVGIIGLPVSEYTPNQVKKTVVGAGHADKEQIGFMVRRLLPGCLVRTADAADALAVAICHAQNNTGLARRIAAAGEVRPR
jgi:crossover junction endodeoxyribonuclease RuvC